MNPYLKNLNKIEFVVTYACTGRCKHCSEGDHTSCGERISPDVAAEAVRRIAAEYDIRTVMTFGGEPLLYPDAVCAIMNAACEMDVPKRQLITNGYFTKNADTVFEVAERLARCGVNDLLLSVDAFHQETIPLETVRLFAEALLAQGIPVRLHPAWLIDAEHDDPYDRRTREVLEALSDLDIPVGKGNIVFPKGNALIYLSDYFTNEPPKDPYVEDPFDVRCVSFSPNGDVLCDNVCRRDIIDILENYDPKGER